MRTYFHGHWRIKYNSLLCINEPNPDEQNVASENIKWITIRLWLVTDVILSWRCNRCLLSALGLPSIIFIRPHFSAVSYWNVKNYSTNRLLFNSLFLFQKFSNPPITIPDNLLLIKKQKKKTQIQNTFCTISSIFYCR